MNIGSQTESQTKTPYSFGSVRVCVYGWTRVSRVSMWSLWICVSPCTYLCLRGVCGYGPVCTPGGTCGGRGHGRVEEFEPGPREVRPLRGRLQVRRV